MFIFYFIAMCGSVRHLIVLMTDDNDLKLTLHKVVSYVVLRMESTSDANVRRCIFQEYKEWLGTSIDEWVLALPNNWGKPEGTLY